MPVLDAMNIRLFTKFRIQFNLMAESVISSPSNGRFVYYANRQATCQTACQLVNTEWHMNNLT